MKRTIFYFGVALAAAFAFSGAARAQMMGGPSGSYGMMGGWTYPWTSSSSEAQMSASDTQAIAAGQALYGRLQAKQTGCAALTRDDFDDLGEYFMQQITGAGHPAMDAMLSNMMGEEGDTAVHVAWGERYSGCDTNATFPGRWSSTGVGGGSASGSSGSGYYGFMPMMGYYGYAPMMGYGYGGGWFGWVLMVALWALAIVGIVALARWIARGRRMGWHGRGTSALETLRERYAKGEIDRKEFEEKKKDLET